MSIPRSKVVTEQFRRMNKMGLQIVIGMTTSAGSDNNDLFYPV